MSDLFTRRRPASVAAALAVMLAICFGMTGRTLNWYQDKLHYVDQRWQVITPARVNWSEPHPERVDIDVREPASEIDRRMDDLLRDQLFWSYEIPADVTHVFGDYWDVYRIAFLSGKKVVGIPYPIFPNRFRGWSGGLGPEKGKLFVLGLRRGLGRWRLGAENSFLTGDEVYDPMSRKNWRSPFGLVWRKDGRDPAELARVNAVIPSAVRVGQ